MESSTALTPRMEAGPTVLIESTEGESLAPFLGGPLLKEVVSHTGTKPTQADAHCMKYKCRVNTECKISQLGELLPQQL